MSLLQRNFNEALNTFRNAAELFPQIAEIHYFLAISARGVGKFDLALAESKKTIALQPSGADALALLGALTLDHGNVGDAETLLRRAVALNQKHFNALYDLGRLLVKTNRYAEALPVLQRAAEINSNHPELHYQIFLALSRLKRKIEAERELEIYKQLREQETKPDQKLDE